jgi:autotransporter passenger strand-loop-strand repeat protein
VEFVFGALLGDAVDRNATISSGGTQNVGFAGVAFATVIGSGATQIVSANGLASGATVTGGFQFISGGVASNTTVTNNGEVDVFSAGTAFNATARAPAHRAIGRLCLKHRGQERRR